jgi:hypothetical protein
MNTLPERASSSRGWSIKAIDVSLTKYQVEHSGIADTEARLAQLPDVWD